MKEMTINRDKILRMEEEQEHRYHWDVTIRNIEINHSRVY